MSDTIDFSQPFEWAGKKITGPGIPAQYLGEGKPDRYALNKKTRYKISLDPENMPHRIKATAIREEVHPDDTDLPPLQQRVRLYAHVFESGYVGDGSYAKIVNVHVKQARVDRIMRLRAERETMASQEIYGAWS